MFDQCTSYAISAKRLFDGSTIEPHKDMVVLIVNGIITDVRPAESGDQPVMAVDIVSPGFVDMQINGANDVQFNDTPTVDGISAIAEGARQGGTTHILPTFITADDTHYMSAIQAVADARESGVIGILGVHLEGPFLSPERPGIHPIGCVRTIDETDMVNLETARCGIRLITLAPECARKGTIQRLTDGGSIVFAGHSAANYADMVNAASEGLRGATHLFNAMSQTTVREPSVVGAVLGSQDLYAGLIADGIHVHPINLQIARKALGNRFCLVTDAMLTLAGKSTEFEMHVNQISLDGNQLSNTEGRLAGAHLAMDEAVRNMMKLCNVPLAEALYMASVNPIHALGLERKMGRIEPGYCASLTLLNNDIHATGVIVDGHIFETLKRI